MLFLFNGGENFNVLLKSEVELNKKDDEENNMAVTGAAINRIAPQVSGR
jgi:hypothetical protein